MLVIPVILVTQAVGQEAIICSQRGIFAALYLLGPSSCNLDRMSAAPTVDILNSLAVA